jgi:ribonuclease HII
MDNENRIREKIKNLTFYAGCDEAGAGCGASDLLVAAVILDPNNPIEGLNDSKKLTEKKREELYPKIIEKALDYCIINVSPKEIDTINILQARMEGFRRAINGLKKVDYAIIDGNKIPNNMNIETDYLIKGDEKLACISAASILAKVTRDRLMIEQSKLYPEYNFEKHKGYLTKDHLEALKKYGPCEIHRLSYKPVKLSIKE